MFGLPSPSTSSVIASQIACTASPISAATAAMFAVVEPMHVSFAAVLLVIITTSAFAAAICAVISSLQGKTDLSEDPIFLERIKKGLVSMQSKEDKVKPATHEAKLSVLIFLSGVSVIVLLLLF